MKTSTTLCLALLTIANGCSGDGSPVAERLRSASEPDSHMNPVEVTLSSLVLEGHELHASLRTRQLDSIRDLPPGAALPENPRVSTDAEFVEAIARSASQGSLGSEGIRSALYARYAAGEDELGIYGLEAKTDADADAREHAVREIWGYNTGLDRARVHRKGLIIVVVWHGTVSPECWEAVNARLVDRLNAPGTS